MSILSINKIKNESQTITAEDVPTTYAVTEISRAVTLSKMKLSETLSQRGNGDIKEVWMLMEKALWYCNAVLSGGKNSQYIFIPSQLPEVRSNIQACIQDIQILTTLSNQWYRGENKSPEYDTTYQRLITNAEDSKRILKAHMESRITQMNSSSESGTVVLILAITLSFFVAIVIGWILSHSISTPLREITFRLEEISRGNFEQKAITAGSRDEVGILTNIYNTMLKKLSEFSHQANCIAIGDFTKDITPDSEKDSLGTAFQKMTERLRTVSNVATQVAEGNTDISIQELNTRDILAKSINTMTKAIKLAMNELKIKENNLDNLPTPVIAVDRDMRITFINRAGAALKRKKPEELKGIKCYEIFNATHCNTGKCGVCKCMISGKQEQGEMEIDTEFIKMPVTYSASPIRDSEGNIVGALEYITDITELRNLVQENEEKIEDLTEENRKKVWYQQGLAGISDTIREADTLEELADSLCAYLAELLNSQSLTFYIQADGVFKLTGTYAYSRRKTINSTFMSGEGLAGQAAKEKKTIILSAVPEDYMNIQSSLGESIPVNIVILPLLYKGEVKGVLEAAALEELTPQQTSFLNEISEPVANAVSRLEDQTKLKDMLQMSQDLTEELRASNEVLEEQTLSLQSAQARLEIQQEELKEANEDLKEKSRALEEQKIIVDESNIKLLEQTRELEKSNSYKSEFLANMSHELRTPLNSILVLSGKLMNNKGNNLTARQVKNAGIINECGNDLLNMINDILDIAKIESGKMEVYPQVIRVQKVAEVMKKNFSQFAAEKNLNLKIRIADSTPDVIISDANKLKQITKNLLSNALKFTSQGEIAIDFYTPEKDVSLPVCGLKGDETLAISVRDTGIGIAEDKQALIFEAFRQENGGITRKYGGTGLGLSISTRLCELLGGELQMVSQKGEGSTFTAFLKRNLSSEVMETGRDDEPAENCAPRILIIEDHKKTALQMKTLCEERGYSVLLSEEAEESLKLARLRNPEGIILNLNMKNSSGIEIMDRLKEEEETKNIPLHLIKTTQDNKPLSDITSDEILLFLESSDKCDISLAGKTALLVDDDVRNLYSLEECLRDINMNVLKATDGAMALEVLKEHPETDIVLMDIMMPVMDGYESMRRIRALPELTSLPIIALTAKAMKEDREKCIEAGANDYLSKPVNIQKLINMTSLWTESQ